MLDYIEDNKGKVISGVLLFVAALFLIPASYFSVQENQSGVVTRFGKIHEVVEAGPHFKLPIVDSIYLVAHTINTSKHHMTSFAKDGSNSVDINYSFSYHLGKNENAIKSNFNNFGKSFAYSNFLVQRIEQATRNTISQLEIEDATTKRQYVSERVKELVNNDVFKYGIVLNTISPTISYGKGFEARLEGIKEAQANTQKEKQLTKQAEQTALREILVKEKEVTLAKLTADKNRYATETNALALANKIKLESDAEANAIIAKGEAEAAAQMAQNEALKQSKGLIEYTLAQAQLKLSEAMGNWQGGTPAQIIQGGTEGGLPVFPWMNAMQGIDLSVNKDENKK